MNSKEEVLARWRMLYALFDEISRHRLESGVSLNPSLLELFTAYAKHREEFQAVGLINHGSGEMEYQGKWEAEAVCEFLQLHVRPGSGKISNSSEVTICEGFKDLVSLGNWIERKIKKIEKLGSYRRE